MLAQVTLSVASFVFGRSSRQNSCLISISTIFCQQLRNNLVPIERWGRCKKTPYVDYLPGTGDNGKSGVAINVTCSSYNWKSLQLIKIKWRTLKSLLSPINHQWKALPSDLLEKVRHHWQKTNLSKIMVISSDIAHHHNSLYHKQVFVWSWCLIKL